MSESDLLLEDYDYDLKLSISINNFDNKIKLVALSAPLPVQ